MSTEDLVLQPGERAAVPTGLAVAIPPGHGGFVLPRSGRALKEGLGVANAPGLIDPGYRGELKVILVNLDPRSTIDIKRGEKIAQLVVQRVERVELETVQELDETARGAGGFGSTGR
jgi:dUTP pyrophosphatase